MRRRENRRGGRREGREGAGKCAKASVCGRCANSGQGRVCRYKRSSARSAMPAQSRSTRRRFRVNELVALRRVRRQKILTARSPACGYAAFCGGGGRAVACAFKSEYWQQSRQKTRKDRRNALKVLECHRALYAAPVLASRLRQAREWK